jgi:hypothetical protein
LVAAKAALCLCAELRLHRQLPAVTRSAEHRFDATKATNSLADLAWWDRFRDPKLQQLIRTAITGNYNVAIATARVEQSRLITGDPTESEFVRTCTRSKQLEAMWCATKHRPEGRMPGLRPAC